MVSKAIRWLVNEPDDAAAWDKLFRHFNRTRGKGDVGYQPNEKITIKVNLTVCNADGGGWVAANGDQAQNLQYVSMSREMALSLLFTRKDSSLNRIKSLIKGIFNDFCLFKTGS